MGIARSTYYYKPKKNPPDMELAERIEKIALDFPSYCHFSPSLYHSYMPPEEFENMNNENVKENESHQLVLIS